MTADALPATLGITERRALVNFTQYVRKRFGPRLRDLRLFGSRARGQGHEDSDLDVLAVIDDLTAQERRGVWEHTGDIMTEHDVIVGGLTVSTAHWQDMHDRELRIVTEIERDGVSL